MVYASDLEKSIWDWKMDGDINPLLKRLVKYGEDNTISVEVIGLNTLALVDKLCTNTLLIIEWVEGDSCRLTHNNWGTWYYKTITKEQLNRTTKLSDILSVIDFPCVIPAYWYYVKGPVSHTLTEDIVKQLLDNMILLMSIQGVFTLCAWRRYEVSQGVKFSVLITDDHLRFTVYLGGFSGSKHNVEYPLMLLNMAKPCLPILAWVKLLGPDKLEYQG